MRKLLLTLLVCGALTSYAQNDYFFQGKKFNAAIPSPQQFLGYAIGEHQTRYDRLVAYMNELDRLSDRHPT